MASYLISDADLNNVARHLKFVAWWVAACMALTLAALSRPDFVYFTLPGFIIVFAYLFYIGVLLIGRRLRQTNPKELTAQERTQLAVQETELYEQLSKLAKVKAEHLKQEIERVELDSQLCVLTGSTSSAHPIPKEIIELDQYLKRLENFDLIEKKLKEHIERFPGQAEFVDALGDKYREEFLRKKQ
jgi:hypothetical protein